MMNVFILAMGVLVTLCLVGCDDTYTPKYIQLNPNALPGMENVTTACDHGNRLYSVPNGGWDNGGLKVIPQDPSCKGK
jgi:hypothetical protein